MNVEKIIREYLPNVIHLSLATCVNDRPWVCEVHYVYDENLNLYFRSKESRRHSQEIAENPFVSGNIVEQHSLTQAPRAVYFEGQAEKLEGLDETSAIYKLFSDRFGKDKKILEDAKSPDGHKFYKIKVSKYYVFDARESTPGKKYELDWQ